MGQGQSIDLAPQNPNPWQMKQGGALKKFLPKHQAVGQTGHEFYINGKKNIIKDRYQGFRGDEWVTFTQPISVLDDDGNTDEMTEMKVSDFDKLTKNGTLDVGYMDNLLDANAYTDINNLTTWNQDRSVTDIGRGIKYNTLNYSTDEAKSNIKKEVAPQFKPGYEYKVGNKTYRVIDANVYSQYGTDNGNRRAVRVSQINDPDQNISSYLDTKGGSELIYLKDFNNIVKSQPIPPKKVKSEAELKTAADLSAKTDAIATKVQKEAAETIARRTGKTTPDAATTTVPKTKTTAVPVTTTTPAKTATPGKTLIIPKSVSKPKSDTIYTDDVFKQGGSLTKYQTGTVVKTEVSKSTKNSKTTYSDGTIVIKDPQGTIISTTPGTSNTTTTTAQTDIEKAVRLLAESKGLDPDEIWKNYQAGPTNTNTNRGYSGYPVKIKGKTWDPATGNRTGKIKINPAYGGYNMYNGADGNNSYSSGFMPNAVEIQAMQDQANAKGYNITPTWDKTPLFGRKRLTIEMRTNPNTGQKTPVITNAPDWHPPIAAPASTGPTPNTQTITPQGPTIINTDGIPLNEPMTVPEGWDTSYTAPENTFTEAAASVAGLKRQGGALNRFLPKHQLTGSTDSEEGDLIGKLKYKEKRPMKVNPFAADYMMADMGVAESALNKINDFKLKDQLAYSQEAGQQYDSVGKDMGDYVPTGQYDGGFRPNEMIPTFDTGYEPGNAAGDYGNYSKQGGPISPYPYPSQIPFMQGNGNSRDMSMYSGWSQRPVMAYGGGYQQNMDDAMYLDEDEINQIMAMGGQIEYLD